jgi:hypothetical protein
MHRGDERASAKGEVGDAHGDLVEEGEFRVLQECGYRELRGQADVLRAAADEPLQNQVADAVGIRARLQQERDGGCVAQLDRVIESARVVRPVEETVVNRRLSLAEEFFKAFQVPLLDRAEEAFGVGDIPGKVVDEAQDHFGVAVDVARVQDGEGAPEKPRWKCIADTYAAPRPAAPSQTPSAGAQLGRLVSVLHDKGAQELLERRHGPLVASKRVTAATTMKRALGGCLVCHSMAHGGSGPRNELVRRPELAVQVRDDGLLRHGKHGPELRSCGVPERLDTLEGGISGGFNALVHMSRDLVSGLGERHLDVGGDKAREVRSNHQNNGTEFPP